MNVLSLFDGISCGQIALNKVNIPYDRYFASEIDSDAIKVTQHNYPDTIQLGDVTKISGKNLPQIDLLIGGSPCQGFSKSGKGFNFDDPRSKLFFEFVRLKDELNPKYFILENVRMKNEWRDIISHYIGVEPIMINSNLLSAQNRPRFYWTNIPNVNQPENNNVMLSDIVLEDAIGITLTERRTEEAKKIRKEIRKTTGIDYCPRRGKELVERIDGKSNCLTATFSNKEHLIKLANGGFRRLTPLEWERLQTIPDDYTSLLTDGKRYKVIGNGWTIDVVAHILKNINTIPHNNG